MPDETALRCAGLSVRYGPVAALDGVDLAVAPGELVALLGASGSGKSTLLHAIAGLVQPAEGGIWLGGRQVAGARRHVPPERRSVGLVFQDFALWPHLSAVDTVAYPLRRAGVPRSTAHEIARQHLDALGIGELANRRPAELSGGQQQRVGLARALAREPEVFLLDEPTAHLDTPLRGAFQDAVRERLAATAGAAIYATHDAAEALGVADHVALLVAGRLVQLGTPESVYAQPVSEAAAALTGEYSIIAAEPDRPPMLVRPEWAHVGGPRLSTIVQRTFRGAHTDYRLDVGGGRVLVRAAGPPQHAVGDELAWGIDRAWALPDSAERGDGAGPRQPVVHDLEVQPGVVLERS